MEINITTCKSLPISSNLLFKQMAEVLAELKASNRAQNDRHIRQQLTTLEGLAIEIGVTLTGLKDVAVRHDKRLAALEKHAGTDSGVGELDLSHLPDLSAPVDEIDVSTWPCETKLPIDSHDQLIALAEELARGVI